MRFTTPISAGKLKSKHRIEVAQTANPALIDAKTIIDTQIYYLSLIVAKNEKTMN